MILNKDVLVNNIVTEISDNSTGQISPYDIRHNLLDIIDSVHLLTKGYPLDGLNFGTPAVRSTRVGDEALSKLGLAGYYSIDNTAVGNSALRANYQSSKNTAIGSNSLFCNIYGENNTAIGYSSLGGNTIGYNNIGLGNFALNNNKSGSSNIAIGHGAGYYAKDEQNKLFIASHNVNSEYICDNPLGSGLTPLVYGDLDLLRFGIGTRSLHSSATLQVSGHISPRFNELSNLGSSSYRYRYLFLASGISLGTTLYFGKKDDTSFHILGDLVPYTHNFYDLGSQNNQWAGGYFNNIYVSGTATMNRFVATETCNFLCKTINLAQSGTISLDGGGPNSLYDYSYESNSTNSLCGYLTDIDLTGAGFNINSSGIGYFRTYSFTYAPPNNSLSCLQSDNAFSRSSWNSNISLHLANGTHLLTDRVIFPSSINIVNSSGCFGLFSRGSGLFFSKSELVSQNQHPSEYLAGVGDVNFYATSGDSSEYIFNLGVPDSGVTVKQRLLTGIKKKSIDSLNNNLDKLSGFELQYVDNSASYITGPLTDRLVIGSYHNSSSPINALTLMKNNDSEGIVGITNLSPLSQNLLPVTSLNIRSSTNAIGRFSAENQSQTKAAIQLLGGSNCLENGLEISYLNGSGIADINMYNDSGRQVYVRFYEGVDNPVGNSGLYRLGILNSVSGINSSGDVQGMLSLGSQTNTHASISMREYTYGTPLPSLPTRRPSSSPNRGIFFISPKPATFQQHSLFMIDGSGYVHDLVVNKFDTFDGRALYTDVLGNTLGGLQCPDSRDDLFICSKNTAIGNYSLNKLTSGGSNSIFGYNAASGLTFGSNNIVFGSNSAVHISGASNNIVIGTNSFNTLANSGSSNIIIGNNGTGNSISGNYNFVLGHDNVVLLDGKLGPTDANKILNMPSGGRFSIYNSTNADALRLSANNIEVLDLTGNNYPDQSLTFSFVGVSGAQLLKLNHSAVPMSGTPLYELPDPDRPFAELNGDLKLRGAIRFSDQTSLSSTAWLPPLVSGVNKNTQDIETLFGFFTEGYVPNEINPPSHGSVPTTGVLNLKNANWQDVGQVTLVNRDTTSLIHAGAYVIAIKINNEFRPLWISAKDTSCQCCR